MRFHEFECGGDVNALEGRGVITVKTLTLKKMWGCMNLPSSYSGAALGGGVSNTDKDSEMHNFFVWWTN